MMIERYADRLCAARLKPRLRDITGRLRKIESKATELARMVSEHDLDLADAFEDRIPPRLSFLRERMLQEVSELASTYRHRLVGEYGFGAPLRVLLHGTDKKHFVTNLALLWATYREHDGLSAYENGPLAEFVLKCWKWAMGTEDMSGLERDLKGGVRVAREWLKAWEKRGEEAIKEYVLAATNEGAKSPREAAEITMGKTLTEEEWARVAGRWQSGWEIALEASTTPKKRKGACP